jgi:L-alanine-DL-glutamate epimerase-like enolase superfamily enzyme
VSKRSTTSGLFGAGYRRQSTREAGEQHSTIWSFRRLLHEAEVDVLQHDLYRCMY